jgi:hypothetical protein
VLNPLKAALHITLGEAALITTILAPTLGLLGGYVVILADDADANEPMVMVWRIIITAMLAIAGTLLGVIYRQHVKRLETVESNVTKVADAIEAGPEWHKHTISQLAIQRKRTDRMMAAMMTLARAVPGDASNKALDYIQDILASDE